MDSNNNEQPGQTHPDPSKLTQTDHINKKLLMAFQSAMDNMNIPANAQIATDDDEREKEIINH